jgi:hypothetical protein
LLLERRPDGFTALACRLDELFTRPHQALLGKLRLNVISLAKQQGKPIASSP